MPPTDPTETEWRIEPAGPLNGEVHVSGSKNAVTKLMVASMLADSPSTIVNAPQVGDVQITARVLEDLGAGVEITREDVTLDPTSLDSSQVPITYSGLNRIPILMLGPLLHRIGEAFIPMVGGDRIGSRPVDLHIKALEALGAEVILTSEGLEAKATRLKGARIQFPFPSVGATENAMLAAVCAEGRTVIENAAIEPEVVELALFLQRMGARIELKPDRRFMIEGVPRLHGAYQRLGGDRIEAFSYLVAGVATGGRVKVSGCVQGRLVTAISTLHRMGVRFEITDDYISARADDLRGAAVQTSPHPGFMTDWHPPLLVLFTQAEGMSVMHETVFEERFNYIDPLKKMGAEIEVFDQCLGGEACRFHEAHYLHSAVVKGRSALKGIDAEIPDVRAGFAYMIAAAAAEGSSTFRGLLHLERGYDRPLEKFRELGMKIEQA